MPYLASKGIESFAVSLKGQGLSDLPKNGKASSLASGKLSVPAALWKVIVVLPIGSDDLSRINDQTRVIAVVMPNTNAAGPVSWGLFRTSVDELERQTGFDLLSNVPERVQRVIEARQDAITI